MRTKLVAVAVCAALVMTLLPAGAVAQSRDVQLRRPWRLATSAVLVGAGALLSGAGIYWLMQQGECPSKYKYEVVDDGSAVCSRHWSVGPTTIAYLSVGLPLLVGGSTWLGFELRPYVPGPTSSAEFRLKGTF